MGLNDESRRELEKALAIYRDVVAVASDAVLEDRIREKEQARRERERASPPSDPGDSGRA